MQSKIMVIHLYTTLPHGVTSMSSNCLSQKALMLKLRTIKVKHPYTEQLGKTIKRRLSYYSQAVLISMSEIIKVKHLYGTQKITAAKICMNSSGSTGQRNDLECPYIQVPAKYHSPSIIEAGRSNKFQ